MLQEMDSLIKFCNVSLSSACNELTTMSFVDIDVYEDL